MSRLLTKRRQFNLKKSESYNTLIQTNKIRITPFGENNSRLPIRYTIFYEENI